MSQAHLDGDALYAALDEARKSKDLSWRTLAKEAQVSPSTLTRMAQGQRPDVDSFAKLVGWLGIPADAFLCTGESASKKRPEPMAAVVTLLRAEKNLSPESAKALETIIRAAYDQLKEK